MVKLPPGKDGGNFNHPVPGKYPRALTETATGGGRDE